MIEINLDPSGKLIAPSKCFICQSPFEGVVFHYCSRCSKSNEIKISGFDIWYYLYDDGVDTLHIIVDKIYQIVFSVKETKIIQRDPKMGWSMKPLLVFPYCLEIQYEKELIRNKLYSLINFL